jgi:hypothetical protein
MTNDDLRNMEIGLIQMKRLNVRPVLNMMITYCLNTLKPATSALTEAQEKIREEFLELNTDPVQRGVDPRNEDGSLKMKAGKSVNEYDKEIDTLFRANVEVTLPKFRFRVLDFMESNISFQPEITEKLGSLVNYEGFEDFVANMQQATPLPTKGSTTHRSP